MPFAIVPNAVYNLGLEDKDGNTVQRIIVAADQAEEVSKACRKKGYVAKVFSFDHEKWVQDKREYDSLKENYDNKTTNLH